MTKLLLREAEKEDSDFLFFLRNDPETRRQSFHTAEISREEHEAWFVRMLEDANTKQYILERDGEPVGQFRVKIGLKDSDPDRAEVSYAVAPTCRGQGIGTKLLRMGSSRVWEDFPQIITLVGEVKRENTASRKAFLANLYEEQKDPARENILLYFSR